MKKLSLSIVVCVLALLAVAQNKGKVESLSWMAGTWQCEIWGGTFEEHWSAPRGGSMVGNGRHMSGGKTGFMEFMSVESDANGEVTMWMLLGSPSKGEKKGVPFKMTASTKYSATFENPQNDFPSKIAYRRSGDKLICVISGKQDGKDSAETFNFVPVK